MRVAKTDRRDLLLCAARESFAECPFDAVSIADIAHRAKVAYGLIAHYFGSKRGLYLATMQSVADELRAFRSQPVETSDPALALRAGVRRHISYFEQHADGFKALMRGGIGSDEDVRKIVLTLRWEAAERVLTGLQVHRPIGPELYTAMHGWVGFFDEAVLAWLDRKELSIEQLTTLIVVTLLANLRAIIQMNAHTGIDASLIERIEQSAFGQVA